MNTFISTAQRNSAFRNKAVFIHTFINVCKIKPYMPLNFKNQLLAKVYNTNTIPYPTHSPAPTLPDNNCFYLFSLFLLVVKPSYWYITGLLILCLCSTSNRLFLNMSKLDRIYWLAAMIKTELLYSILPLIQLFADESIDKVYIRRWQIWFAAACFYK